MRKIVQILLFVVSYAPLYLILLFQNINDNVFIEDTNAFIGFKELLKLNVIPIAFLLLIIISISLYFLFFNIVLKSAPEKHKISEVKDNHAEHLSYLATYILPFVGLKFDTWQSVLATIALFYVLGHIYIKTNLILTNPTLTFFGYSISKIVDTTGKTKFIIHKAKLVKDKELDLIPIIDNNIYILKNEPRSNHPTN
jgi:hypothetical protein